MGSLGRCLIKVGLIDIAYDVAIVAAAGTQFRFLDYYYSGLIRPSRSSFIFHLPFKVETPLLTL